MDRDRQYVWCIKNVNINKAVSATGRNSLAYFNIRRTGSRSVHELNENQLETIKPFVNRDLFCAIKETLPIAYNNARDLDYQYSMIAGSRLQDLSKATSKEIRLSISDKDPITIYKIGVFLTPSEALSLANQINKITSVRHKDILLRLMHGELYSRERLSRYGLVDTPNCSRCMETETLTHKYLECPYTRAIWSKCLNLTKELRMNYDPNEEEIDKIFCCHEPDKLILTIHAEIMLRIRGLKDDVDHLLLPKLFVKNAISMVGKRERKQEIRAKVLELLED